MLSYFKRSHTFIKPFILTPQRFNSNTVDSLKDEIYTIAIIGRPNVGKSTLFNRLMGEKLALVDKTPGLTRDRREGITQMFNIPIRLVDTAGFEGTTSDATLEARQLNRNMVNDMLMQTRNALIYSDLALFMLDSRSGITHNDVMLYRWLTQKELRLPKQAKLVKPKGITETDIKIEQVLQERIEQVHGDQFTITPGQAMAGLQEIKKQNQKVKTAEANKLQKDKLQEGVDFSQKIPPILYVSNKSEDGFEGEVLADFYLKFPQLTTAIDPVTNLPYEPIFISAEHGDGLPDLFQRLRAHIPQQKEQEYEDRKQKRVERYNKYKAMLIDEIVQVKKEELDKDDVDSDSKDFSQEIEIFVKSWEKEFEFVNKNPQENSDFDSDNEINPLDTLDSLGRYMSSAAKQTISSENQFKKKPIQLTIIGKPNVGKSTLVNQLLQESRVIANDLAGTTRDAVRVQWIYAGRRITLVDTAGIKTGGKQGSDQVELLMEEEVRKAIQFSHVVAVIIDSMQGFTSSEMTIVKRVVDEGRAVVIVANKWDLVDDKYKKKAIKWMEKQLEKGLGQAKGIPIAYVSAKTGHRTDRIMDEVLRVYEKWNTRVSTGLLNKWIHAFSKVQKMPSEKGKMLKMRYLMQIKTRPPTFFMYCNNKRLMDANFEQFIRNSISKEFGFIGVPVRILVRDSRTQYAKRKMSQVSASARSVLNRIRMYKYRQKNIAYRRRLAGNRFLYKGKTF